MPECSESGGSRVAMWMYQESELFMNTSEGVGMSHQSQDDTRNGVSRARTVRRGGLADAWARLGAALQDAATRDPQVRDAMHTVGAWLHDLAGESAPASSPDRTAIDLALVAERSRLKAEACRWVLRRREHERSGEATDDALRAADLDLINKARDMRGCWLWMLQQGAEAPDAIYEQLALVYEALANATEICDRVSARSGLSDRQLSEIYHLLAEAQSALWAGMQTAGAQRDQDQIDAFVWLRERTREERVYIERHMRREDPADPAAAPDLLDRIARAAETIGDAQPEDEREPESAAAS